MREIILDTETTGLSFSKGDRIIEFAGLEMINRRLTGNLKHFYINPQRDISEDAIKVHGINLEKLKNSPTFLEVSQEIFDFIKDSQLVIHNAPFDIGFLNMEFEKAGFPSIEKVVTVVDTLELARKIYPGRKNSLDALCERLSIDKSKRSLHGALIDCDLLAKVYLYMTSSQYTLDMEDISDYSYDLSEQSIQNIKLIYPDQKEQLLHKEYIEKLDKITQGNSIYTLLNANG